MDLVYALGKVDTTVPAHHDVTELLLLLHLPLPQRSVGAVCIIIDPAPLIALLHCCQVVPIKRSGLTNVMVFGQTTHIYMKTRVSVAIKLVGYPTTFNLGVVN